MDTERFLEEKRLFFREGDELMRMNNKLYYSRRFTDIDGGVQFSGQLDDYKFAFVDVYGVVSHDGLMRGNSGVMRVLKSVNERSNLGGYVSTSEFDRGHSRVVGHDGYVFLSDSWRVRYQVAGADEQAKTAGGLIFYASDYWKSITLGGAHGRFETMNYNEASLEKHFKFIEKMPIRYEFVARLEEPMHANSRVAWLNRIGFDFYFTKTMWLKSSIQHRDSSLHNLSFIYGWEFRPRTYWYLVFNNVAKAEDDETSSIFTKIQKTF